MDNSKGIKIILLGESGVGKTNLINITAGKDFNPNSASSLASSFIESYYESENKKYLFCLWDTAGQERFRALNKIFIKGTKIVMVVFAINSKHSFEQIDYWVNYTKEVLGDEKFILALVANKSDLYEEQVIPDNDIINFAKEHNIKYTITSALSDAAGFRLFVNELVADYIKLIGPEAEEKLYFVLKPTGNKDNNKKKKFC